MRSRLPASLCRYQPFGKKSSIAIVNEEGELEKESSSYERQDFWTTTKNGKSVRDYMKIGAQNPIMYVNCDD